MKIDISKLKHHPLSIAIYGDSTNEEIDDLIASIGDYDLKEPLVINKKNQILSGNRRLEALKKLGWDKVPVIIKNIKPENELEEIINRNVSRKRKARMIAHEINKLYELYGVGQGKRTEEDASELKHSKRKSTKINVREKVADILRIGEGTIQKYRFIDKNNPELFEDIDNGVYSLDSAYKKALEIALEVQKSKESGESEEAQTKGEPPVSNESNFIEEEQPLDLSQCIIPSGTKLHTLINLEFSKPEHKNYSDKIVHTFLESYNTRIQTCLEDHLDYAIGIYEDQVEDILKKERNYLFSLFSNIELAIRQCQFTPLKVSTEDKNNKFEYISEEINLTQFLEHFGISNIKELSQDKQSNLLLRVLHYRWHLTNGFPNESVKKEPFIIALPKLFEINISAYTWISIQNNIEVFRLHKKLSRTDLNQIDRDELERKLAPHYSIIRDDIRNRLKYFE
ncbi:MAG: ParB N-terminal domain-containing protein [Bacteroidota bacterium]